MDIVQDYFTNALHLYNTADPYLRPVLSTLSTLKTQFTPLLLPPLTALLNYASASPSYVGVGLLLLFLVLALQILSLMRRIMMWWLRVVWWVSLVSVLVLVGSAVAQRGIEESVLDVVGWVATLRDVWWREYRRWEGYQNQQRLRQGHAGTTERIWT